MRHYGYIYFAMQEIYHFLVFNIYIFQFNVTKNVLITDILYNCFLGKDSKNSFGKPFKDFRLSAGVGLVARVGNSIRFEFNLCTPFQYTAGDRIVDGFQFGVGANFI